MLGRAWVIAAVALGSVILLPPIGVGILLEDRAREGLDQLRADGTAIEVEFDRGLYRSHWTTTFNVGGDGNGQIPITLHHEIVHGPVPLAAGSLGLSPFDLVFVLARSRLEADPELFAEVADALDGSPVAQLDTRVGVDLNVTLDFESPPFSLQDERFVWHGLDVRSSMKRETGAIDAKLETPGLVAADGQGGNLDIGHVSATLQLDTESNLMTTEFRHAHFEMALAGRAYRMDQAEGTFATQVDGGAFGANESNIHVAQMSARGGTIPDVRWLDLDFEQQGGPTGDDRFYQGTSRVRFGEVYLGRDSSDGPGGLEFKLLRIDSARIEAFREELAVLEASSTDPDELATQRVFAVLEALPQLLSSSPEVRVDGVTLQGAEGSLQAEASLSVDGSDPSLLSDPFMLMAQMRAQATLDAPEPLLRRVVDALWPAIEDANAGVDSLASEEEPTDLTAGLVADVLPSSRVDAWLEAGFIVRDGDRLEMDARFEDGLPMLNGSPADPSFLMNLMPGM